VGEDVRRLGGAIPRPSDAALHALQKTRALAQFLEALGTDFFDAEAGALGEKGEMFGRHHLEKIVENNCGSSAEELVDHIFNAVSTHAEGVEAFDDQTIVCLKVKGPAAKK